MFQSVNYTLFLVHMTLLMKKKCQPFNFSIDSTFKLIIHKYAYYILSTRIAKTHTIPIFLNCAYKFFLNRHTIHQNISLRIVLSIFSMPSQNYLMTIQKFKFFDVCYMLCVLFVETKTNFLEMKKLQEK